MCIFYGSLLKGFFLEWALGELHIEAFWLPVVFPSVYSDVAALQ